MDKTSGVTDEDVELYAQQLLTTTREELQRADQKAALLLAATGVVVGALLTGFINGKWVPYQLPGALQVLWWLGISAAAVGLFAIGTAVFPRVKRRGAHFTGVAYYGDVVNAGADDLRSALRRTLSAGKSPYVDQLFQNARVVDRKYRGIRVGLLAFAGASVACTFAVTVGSIV